MSKSDAGKGDDRRPCCVSRREETLHYKKAFEGLTAKEELELAEFQKARTQCG